MADELLESWRAGRLARLPALLSFFSLLCRCRAGPPPFAARRTAESTTSVLWYTKTEVSTTAGVSLEERKQAGRVGGVNLFHEPEH
jgi:hypothetical protein